MSEITQELFLAKLQIVNSTIHSALTTTSTIATTVSPISIAVSILDSIGQVQADINGAKESPPFLAVISKDTSSNPQEGDAPGIYYLVKEKTLTYQQQLISGAASEFVSR
jgi:hypothetical protein